jgi:hypothetical protein
MIGVRVLTLAMTAALAAAASCAPPSASSAVDAGGVVTAGCHRAGDTCDFSPGKIGVCTEPVEGCAGVASCYVCTSLH